MVWTAAALFALNGTVSKVVLEPGSSSRELTQARSAGACAGFALVLALTRPSAAPRFTRRELGFLAVFGIAGVASVQWLYFVAIQRLPVGIALLIQYIGPLLLALWARFVMHARVRRRVWVALVLALRGALADRRSPWRRTRARRGRSRRGARRGVRVRGLRADGGARGAGGATRRRSPPTTFVRRALLGGGAPAGASPRSASTTASLLGDLKRFRCPSGCCCRSWSSPGRW